MVDLRAKQPTTESDIILSRDSRQLVIKVNVSYSFHATEGASVGSLWCFLSIRMEYIDDYVIKYMDGTGQVGERYIN